MAKSDFDEENFFSWMGHCISSWAKMEEELFKICWQSLKAPKNQSAIVYFRTPTVDARISLTDELVKSVLPKPERKDGGHTHSDVIAWNKIQSDIKSALSIRRRIAHHPVRLGEANFTFQDDDPFKGDGWQLFWYEIYVSEHENARGKDISPQNLILTDLVDHERAVSGFARNLKGFRADVLSKHVREPAELGPRRKRATSKDNPA
jgi:hypothetical protein